MLLDARPDGNPLDSVCPNCGAKGNFVSHGHYFRHLVSPGKRERPKIKRVKCLSCNATHAILPKDVVPYRIYAESFVLAVLATWASGVSNSKVRKRFGIAEYRFGLIAPTLNGTYPDASMAAYFRRIAQNPLELPDGSKAKVNPSTLASWRRRYKELGFNALLPKQRSDRGRSRRIDDDLAKDIQQMRVDNPRMGAQLVLDELVSQGRITKGAVSVATIQRFFRRHPVEGVEKDVKDRRAFESARVDGIWQADTLYGPYVGTPAKRAYLQAIIDDKSRKIVSARFVESDCAATFQGTLKRAVASHGIPEKLFVDNGGPYANEQLSLICGTLGIVLIHAAVRDGASKGKILYAA